MQYRKVNGSILNAIFWHLSEVLLNQDNLLNVHL